MLGGPPGPLNRMASYAHTHGTCRGEHPTARADSLFAELNMLDEHDLAVAVLENVVPVEPIAIRFEIVDSLDALEWEIVGRIF